MGRKFQDSTGADLPVGSHEPCQLLSITRHEPSEENLKKWPDMKPSLCFRFMLYRPADPELHGGTGVRFTTDSVSKLGKLYEFTTDLCDGDPPDEFDEGDYVGEWYRIMVRKKTGTDKLFVSTASPIDEPDDVPDGWAKSEAVEKARKKAAKRLKRQQSTAVEDEEELAAVAGDGSDDDDPF